MRARSMEIRTILVPTDFSTYAAHALQEAVAVAAHYQAQVLLVHVLPPLAFWGGGLGTASGV